MSSAKRNGSIPRARIDADDGRPRLSRDPVNPFQ